MLQQSLELQGLTGSVVLLLLLVFIQAQTANAEKGQAWAVSPRDGIDNVPQGLLSGRAKRALENYKETLPAFIALVLLLVLTHRTGGLGQLGVLVWIGARLIYIPLYLAGVPYLRTLAWLVSIGGLVMMLVRLFTGG